MRIGRALFIAGKGGSGKTTLAITLALHWARQGKQVGLLDANLSSPDVPAFMGLGSQGIEGLLEGIEPVSPMEGLKVVSMGLFLHRPWTPVSWRGPVRHGVLKQFVDKTAWGELDVLMVDLPPGIGEEILTLIHLLRERGKGLLVATGDASSTMELKRLKALFQQAKVPVLGWVKNRLWEDETAEVDLPLLGSLPFDQRVHTLAQKGEFLLWRQPGSPFQKALEDVARRCWKALEDPSPIPVTVRAQILWRR